jgi:hypothetical protein
MVLWDTDHATFAVQNLVYHRVYHWPNLGLRLACTSMVDE